jgi:hypothetical protein
LSTPKTTPATSRYAISSNYPVKWPLTAGALNHTLRGEEAFPDGSAPNRGYVLVASERVTRAAVGAPYKNTTPPTRNTDGTIHAVPVKASSNAEASMSM